MSEIARLDKIADCLFNAKNLAFRLNDKFIFHLVDVAYTETSLKLRDTMLARYPPGGPKMATRRRKIAGS